MNLRILLDQNVPPALRDFLLRLKPSWLVHHVSELDMSGASDEEIFRYARDERAVIVTFDEDFADARMYPVGTHAGVIRLRIWPTTIEEMETALSRLLSQVADEMIPESLIIIDRANIRIRRSAQHG